MINLDKILDLFAETGAKIIDMYHNFDVVINEHTYSGFVALIAGLAFNWLACWIWGDNDNDDD